MTVLARAAYKVITDRVAVRLENAFDFLVDVITYKGGERGSHWKGRRKIGGFDTAHSQPVRVQRERKRAKRLIASRRSQEQWIVQARVRPT